MNRSARYLGVSLLISLFALAPPALAFDFGGLIDVLKQKAKDKKTEQATGKEKSSKKSQEGFSNFLNVITGGGATAPANKKDVLAEALKQMGSAKKLKERSEKISRQMDSAMAKARYMQALTGTSLLSQYKALKGADHALETSEDKQAEMARLFQFKFPPQTSLTETVKVVAKNVDQNRILLNAVKAETARFEQLSGGEIKSLGRVKQSLMLTGASFNVVVGKSTEVRQSIDGAIKNFEKEGGEVVVESVKLTALIALQIKNLVDLTSQLKSNPLQGIAMLARALGVIKDLKALVETLNNFKKDHKYIEDNAGVITGLGRTVIGNIEEAKLFNQSIKAKMVSIGENSQELDAFVSAQEGVMTAAVDQKQKEIITEEGLD